MNLQDMVDGQTIQMKWIIGRKKKPVSITLQGERLWLKYGFSKAINTEIKESFAGYKYHGFDDTPKKQWSILHCAHNWFQILFLCGLDPYGRYDEELVDFNPTRSLYAHQVHLARHILTRRHCIAAAEMGTGKTLTCIEVMEASGLEDWFWVGPKSALASVQLEFRKWDAKIHPRFSTYASLEKHNREWEPGRKVYQGIIFDECSRLKTPSAKRTQAAQYLADAIRDEWENEGIIVLMSGTPAPKSPVDWYSQCEVSRPGFLREGSINKFKQRLSIIQQRESAAGGSYPHLVTWLDDADKCAVCGEQEKHEIHNIEYILEDDGPYHNYKASENEVSKLDQRMKGLVMVKFKKDCLDLPDKIYQKIHCDISAEIKRSARLIAAKCPSTIKALTLLRQLSDGFQYTEVEDGVETCGVCSGNKTLEQPIYIGPEKTWKFLESIDALPSWFDINEIGADPDHVLIDPSKHPDLYENQIAACPHCKGVGEVTKYIRNTDNVACPKETALRDLLDQHWDIGRIVIYGGFTGSIDRCVDIVTDAQWDYIRMDGRGVASSIGGNTLALLETFQDTKDTKRIAFIGQPGAAGMGLNLTASPSVVYYSNDFNAESRIQSEDRIHRVGMDKNRGATIYDIIHLPTDELVLENLHKKRKLQNMSLGQVTGVLDGV